MPAMTKRVNVTTTMPVRSINPPISGSRKNVIMSTSDILKCLCRRAKVEEILPDGSTVTLNMRNYYQDNGAGLDAHNPPKVVATPPKSDNIPEKSNVVSGADLFNDAQPDTTNNENNTYQAPAHSGRNKKKNKNRHNNNEPVVETNVENTETETTQEEQVSEEVQEDTSKEAEKDNGLNFTPYDC